MREKVDYRSGTVEMVIMVVVVVVEVFSFCLSHIFAAREKKVIHLFSFLSHHTG